MELLKKYSEKFGVKKVANDLGEYRQTSERSIVFPNGWVASIVENNGVDVYHPDGKHTKEYKSNKKYSVAICDYNGFFNWSILNQYGAIDGCLYCDDELEIIMACETIRRLKNEIISEKTVETIVSVLINSKIEAENANKNGINDEYINSINSALEEIKNIRQ